MASNPYPFNIPGWADGVIRTNGMAVPSAQAAYTTVPLVQRANIMRANDLSAVPAGLVNSGGDVYEWPFDIAIERLLWQTEVSLLLRGQAFILKQRRGARVVNLMPLNAFSVEVVMLADGITPTFQQWVNGRRYPANGVWTLDDIIYIRNYDPRYDIAESISPTQVCLSDASLLKSLASVPAAYFGSGMMPITVISGFPATTQTKEIERYEGFFRRVTSGLSSIGRVLGMKGDIKAQVITPPLKDLAIPELYTQAVKNVAFAFGIPEARLLDPQAYAAAVVSEQWYYNSTVLPEANIIAGEYNRQLLGDAGLTFEFYPEQMQIFQQEELERASAISAYTALGLTLPEAAEVLGIELPENIVARLAQPTAPPSPEQAQPTTEAVTDESGGLAVSESATVLNGAQIASAMEVLANVSSGAVSDFVAVQLLIALGIDEERAKRMVSESRKIDAPQPTTEAMQSWRKAALLTIGAGVGAPFDSELAHCKTKTETRAVFERHWPKPANDIARLANELQLAREALEK